MFAHGVRSFSCETIDTSRGRIKRRTVSGRRAVRFKRLGRNRRGLVPRSGRVITGPSRAFRFRDSRRVRRIGGGDHDWNVPPPSTGRRPGRVVYGTPSRDSAPPPPTGVHENNRIVREAGGNARRRPESTGHRRSGPAGRKRVDLRCRRDGIPSSLPAALPWPRDPDSCASPRPRKTGRRPPRPTLSAQPADTRVAHSDPTPTVASRVRPGECVSSRARVFPAAPGARTSLPRRR